MIKEDDIERAVDYLRDCGEAARARANVKYLAEFLKTKKAQLCVEFMNEAKSAAKAEQMAMADPAYLEVLEGYKAAVEKDAFHGFKREAASALIDAWRTQQSNARAEGRLG